MRAKFIFCFNSKKCQEPKLAPFNWLKVKSSPQILARSLLSKAQVMFKRLPPRHQIDAAHDENICETKFSLIISVSSSRAPAQSNDFRVPPSSRAFAWMFVAPTSCFQMSRRLNSKFATLSLSRLSVSQVFSFNLFLNRCKQKAGDCSQRQRCW